MRTFCKIKNGLTKINQHFIIKKICSSVQFENDYSIVLMHLSSKLLP